MARITALDSFLSRPPAPFFFGWFLALLVPFTPGVRLGDYRHLGHSCADRVAERFSSGFRQVSSVVR